MGINKLKVQTIFMFFAASLLFAACANNRPPENESKVPESNPSASEIQGMEITTDQSQFTWSIEVASSETADNLSSTQAAVQYGGNVVQIPYEENPGSGNTFLLVQIVIEKQKAGATKFEWDKLYVLDSQGNKFYRHPNDTFLEVHNFKRIKSTDLTIGKNEGFICFEISKHAMNGQLTLVYEAPEGENKTALTIKGNENID